MRHRGGTTMKLRAAAVSALGRVRQRNEDNLFFDGRTLPRDHGETASFTRDSSLCSPRLFGVFDGMGGCSDGDLASFLAAEAARRIFSPEAARQNPCELLERICTAANEHICAEMRVRNAEIGATASMLLFDEDRLTLCNVGDSPILRCRGGQVESLHMEHSERASYERLTGRSADPGRKFPLTQNLGIFPEDLKLQPYFAQIRVRPGDSYLICSDGLTDMVPLEDIRAVLTAGAPPDKSLSVLLERALTAGGRDNITAILLCVTGPSRPLFFLGNCFLGG